MGITINAPSSSLLRQTKPNSQEPISTGPSPSPSRPHVTAKRKIKSPGGPGS